MVELILCQLGELVLIGEVGVTVLDGGLLDNLDVNSPLLNIDVDIDMFRIDTGGVDLFRIFSVLNLLFRITDSCVMCERKEEEVEDVDDGFFDDIGFSSRVGNLGDKGMVEGGEGGADVIDGLLDDLGVVSPS